MTNKKKRIIQSPEFKAESGTQFKCTTDSKHKMSVAPNMLAQGFNATAPNQK